MSVRAALEFDLGETWGIEVACFEADGVTPLPIAGATPKLRMASGGRLALDVDGEVVDAELGVVRFIVPPGDQAEMTAGVHTFTVRVVLGDGRVSDQAHGSIAVRASEFTLFTA